MKTETKHAAAENLPITEIAKLVRADIRAALKAGELAEGVKVSVRISRYSMGQSISATITAAPFAILNAARVAHMEANPDNWSSFDMPEAARPRWTVEAEAALDKVAAILEAYRGADRKSDGSRNVTFTAHSGICPKLQKSAPMGDRPTAADAEPEAPAAETEPAAPAAEPMRSGFRLFISWSEAAELIGRTFHTPRDFRAAARRHAAPGRAYSKTDYVLDLGGMTRSGTIDISADHRSSHCILDYLAQLLTNTIDRFNAGTSPWLKGSTVAEAERWLPVVEIARLAEVGAVKLPGGESVTVTADPSDATRCAAVYAFDGGEVRATDLPADHAVALVRHMMQVEPADRWQAWGHANQRTRVGLRLVGG